MPLLDNFGFEGLAAMITYLTQAKGGASWAYTELEHPSGNLHISAGVNLRHVSFGIGPADPSLRRLETESKTTSLEGTAITHEVHRQNAG